MCVTERPTNIRSLSACNSPQIGRQHGPLPTLPCSSVSRFSFPGAALLPTATVGNPLWRLLSLLVLFPVVGVAATSLPREHGVSLTCSPCAGCSEGNSATLKTPPVAKPACPLTTSSPGRGVLNIVFYVSCADKSLPWLLPGLTWSRPWTGHKSLRRGWVSPSDRHSPAHALVGTFPWISINRLGWWLFQYLPLNICSFPFPWKNNIKRLYFFS